jgi:uncharacterized protein
MRFIVRELEVRRKYFDLKYEPGEIQFDDADLRQLGPLHTQGQAELMSNTLGEIRVRGTIRVTMQAPCDRCLEPAKFELDGPFDLFYRPADGELSDETHLDEGEAEMGFYEGDGLELEDVLREQVLLTIPMQHLCREGCQGMCPVCGRNRNEQPCQCHVEVADDRWQALRNLPVKR